MFLSQTSKQASGDSLEQKGSGYPMSRPPSSRTFFSGWRSTNSSRNDGSSSSNIASLKKEFKGLLQKDEQGKLTPYELLNFQDKLRAAAPSIKSDSAFSPLKQMTEELIIKVCENNTPILSDRSYSSQNPQDGSKNSTLPQGHFIYDEQQYVRRVTRGEGSCAIHALLGEETHNGSFQFPGPSASSSERAKLRFTKELVGALNAGNPIIIEKTGEVIKGYLNAADLSAQMLFSNNPLGHQIKGEWDTLKRKHLEVLEKLRAEEGGLWLPLVQDNGGKNPILDAIMEEVEATTKRGATDSPYYNKSRAKVLEMFSKDPKLITACVGVDSACYLSLLSDEDATLIREARSQVAQALIVREKASTKFALSKRVVEHYLATVNTLGFFLNTNEILLGAHLFNKKVLLVASAGSDIIPSEMMNEYSTGELVVIHYASDHFERCTKVGMKIETSDSKREQEESKTKTSGRNVSSRSHNKQSPPLGHDKPISVKEMNNDKLRVRGFDKMVQGPWLEKQLQKVCGTEAHFGNFTYASNNHTALDLNKLLKERDVPNVVLINYSNHYSLVVYEPKEKKIYRFNSLSTEENSLEKKVIDKMQELFSTEKVIKNKTTPQKDQDGWSCAFHVMYFLESLLEGSSMEDVEVEPLSQESLASRLTNYYQYLCDEQEKIPTSHRLYFEVSLDDKNISQLKSLMKTVCSNGWIKKTNGQDKQNHMRQVECILIKMWLMQKQESSTFIDFIKKMGDFTTNQRRFLHQALERMEWSRDAMVRLFYQTYFNYYKCSISPD